MDSTILYRAARSSTAPAGACFADCRSDAEAYREPGVGHGGPRLYTVTVDYTRRSYEVLDLTCGYGLEELQEALGLPRGVRYGDHETSDLPAADRSMLLALEERSVERAVDHRTVRERLAAAGYEWVVYLDTYPADCVTWVYLGTSALELTEVEL